MKFLFFVGVSERKNLVLSLATNSQLLFCELLGHVEKLVPLLLLHAVAHAVLGAEQVNVVKIVVLSVDCARAVNFIWRAWYRLGHWFPVVLGTVLDLVSKLDRFKRRWENDPCV